MHSFKDNAGRMWELSITVAAAKRVRGLLTVDLYALVTDGFKGLSELLSDPIKLVDVIYVLVKPQADAANVSDEAFGGALAGDTLNAAADAFLGELVDFFPQPAARESLRKLLAKTATIKAQILGMADKELDALDPESLAKALFASLMKRPASSE